MCGIVGWYGGSSYEEEDKGLLRKMMDLLIHRGPDESGMLLYGPVRFGHRRLCIIDPSGGHQPMVDARGKRAIIFNGEIYNFREWRETLARGRYSFRTRSDTEVLLAMYDRYGLDFLKYLNGMFAFALWDGLESRMILARDRLGIKPLYYTSLKDGTLVFASEIKAILAYPGVEREANLEALSSYLSFRRPLDSETLFKGIYLLQPGCYLEVKSDRVCLERYWSLPLEKYEDVSEAECIEKTRELLGKAVERRLISDVPLGAFLSGGLDSSAVVALMSDMLDEPVKTYSIGFPEEDYNELEHSRKIASLFKTEHSEIIMEERNYLDLLPKLISFKDEPLSVANEIALYELSRYLKKDITVVLSGEGADELFAGYGRIFRSPYDYQRLNEGRSGGAPVNDSLLGAVEKQYGKVRFEDETDHFLSQYRWFEEKDKEFILSKDTWESIREDRPLKEKVRDIFDSISILSHYDKYLYFFQRFHLENLLRRVDMTTMANSVEARVPFVDHELVEHVFRIPFEMKLKWKSDKQQAEARFLISSKISEVLDTPKYILKKLMRNRLPEEIISRRKVGFPIPLDRYFNGSFSGYSKEILRSSATKNRGIFNVNALEHLLDRCAEQVSHSLALKIWMLVNVELWFRIYFDKEAP